MTISLGGFQREVQERISQDWSKDSPKLIYHYTSAQSLISIIENRELWLSRSEFLNDPQEMNYGIGVIENVLNNYEIQSKDEQILLDNTLTIAKLINARPKYILSLSAEPDSLMLWSHYAKSDGYAIGFDTVELLQQFRFFDETSNLKSVTYLGTVTYDYDVQKQDIQSFLRSILEMYRKLDKVAREEIIQWLAHMLGGGLASKSLMYKDHSFYPEREYRFVCLQFTEQSTPNPISFRSSNGVIIPFVKLALDYQYKDDTPPKSCRTEQIQCIREIRLGPGHTNDNTSLGIRSLLNERHLESVHVNQSAFRLR